MSTAAEAPGYRSSATARAALYRELLSLGLDPERIFHIPGDVLDAMAAKYEPAPTVEPQAHPRGPVDEVVFAPGGGFTDKFREALRLEIRRGGGLSAVLQ